MSKPVPTTRRQGTLALVLIASTGGLAGCGPDPNDAPITMSRAEYTQVEDCIQDWGSEADCEFDPSGMDQPGAAASGPNNGSSSHLGAGSRHSGGLRWLGPWYSRSGMVYRYDGRVEALGRLPSRASNLLDGSQSLNQLYSASKGRYATASAHPSAHPAKTAAGRGGFGGTGRLFASGGG